MKYILFGTGEYYRRFSHWFFDRNVMAVLDNDKKKQGSMIDGIPVVSPEKVLNYDFDVVVILSFYVAEMKKQLIEIGVDEYKIFHFFDLHELFKREKSIVGNDISCKKNILLLSHDLSLGGPALALYHAALTLKRSGYEVVLASMLDGDLRTRLESCHIPVIIDNRLQIATMNELKWSHGYDLIICNTINYHVFLSERDVSIPVIWWLHDSEFFYDGIREERLKDIDETNMKLVSVGPIPRKAMLKYKQTTVIDDLIYGVSEGM